MRGGAAIAELLIGARARGRSSSSPAEQRHLAVVRAIGRGVSRPLRGLLLCAAALQLLRHAAHLHAGAACFVGAGSASWRLLGGPARAGAACGTGGGRQPRVAAEARGGEVGAAERQRALDTLAESALTRSAPPEEVFEAIRLLEKAKDVAGDSGFASFLTGDWRLIYTTGTKKTEDEIGRVNYVPITAVQRFNMQEKFIRNGVYLGPISLEFEGSLRWIEDRRRLEFDFEDLKICGVSLPLPDFVRSAAGMKSSAPYKKQPAFNFVAVDERIAAARGAGGGVALWLRNELAE
mmetsp:Transcript_48543/g.140657  ORF Transcript_48543/g.140657 Transcript_48543/m.140657 type:complete len:293 (+) Transcript_48543:62-940(+)